MAEKCWAEQRNNCYSHFPPLLFDANEAECEFIMRNRVGKKSNTEQEAEKQQKQKVMKILISNQWDDFMETPYTHTKQFVSGELSLTAY